MSGLFDTVEDRDRLVTGKEAVGRVHGSLSGSRDALARGVSTAEEHWTGPRSTTFTTAAEQARTELGQAADGVGEVVAVLADYATAIDTAERELERCRRGYEQVVHESAPLSTGTVSTGNPYQDLWTSPHLPQAQRFVSDAAAAKRELAGKAVAFAARIDAVTDRVVPGGSTLSPDQLRRQVTDAMGVRDGNGSIQAALATLRQTVPLPATGAPPQQVHDWWSGLSAQEQAALLEAHPGALGNLDGIPVAVRDQANRRVLPSALADAQGRVDARFPDGEPPKTITTTTYQSYGLGPITTTRDNPEWAAWDQLHSQVVGITRIRDRLESGAVPPYFLIGFQPDVGNGRAIVSRGNPDLAAHVSTLVPGTYGSMAGMDGDIGRSDVMYDAARKYTDDSVAAVTWMGYDAPQSIPVEAGQMRFAEAGAPLLSSFQSGLRVTHEGAPSHNTVIGHSYGTTVVGHAAGDDLAVDDVVLVASPGAGVGSGWLETGSVDDLHLDGDSRGHVYATRSPSDSIKWATNATLGVDPTEPGFGATEFSNDPSGGHSDYWRRGNPAVTNLGRIVAGDGADVTPPDDEDQPGPNPLREVLFGPVTEWVLGR